jgi:hypothetical protein
MTPVPLLSGKEGNGREPAGFHLFVTFDRDLASALR